MNGNWQASFNKFLAGSLGTQLGMLFTCSTSAALVILCTVCGLASLLSISASELALYPNQAQSQVAAIATSDIEPAMPVNGVPTTIPQQGSAPPVIQVVEMPITELPAEASSAFVPGQPAPIITADQGKVNLRLGPGTDYPRVAILPENASLEIVGRSSDSGWWLVSTIEGLSWVYANVVSPSNLHQGIPVIDVLVPPPPPGAIALQSGSGDSQSSGAAAPIVPPTPAGTPTPGANVLRTVADQTVGVKFLVKDLVVPPRTKSFHPMGDPIAVMEGVKLHLISGDGSNLIEPLDSNELFRVFGDGVWSPDGKYLAFAVHFKAKKCRPCRSVAIMNMIDYSYFFLKTPDGLAGEAPRWTQDGRIIITVHPREPADGVAYIYDLTGRGQVASGLYQLASSHEGQKWFPWQPGRSWRANMSERPDSYYE